MSERYGTVPVHPKLAHLYEMPTTTEFRRRVEEFTYKPGTEFRVRDDPATETIVFIISADVPDSRSGTGSIPIELHELLDRYFVVRLMEDERFFDMWIKGQVQKFEMHELDEWLLKKGKFVTNPHPGGPDRPPRTAARSQF